MMHDHLNARMTRGHIFSAEVGSLLLEKTSSVVSEPYAKRVRLGEGAGPAACRDVEDDTSGGAEANVLFYELVWNSIGRKRQIPLALGAAGQLREADTAVFVHERVHRIDDGEWLVGGEARKLCEPSYILRGISKDVDDERLVANTNAWASRRSVWTVDNETVIEDRALLLSSLMTCQKAGYKAKDAAETHVLTQLAAMDIAEEFGGRWQFTPDGRSKITLSLYLSEPSRVFQVRDFV